jgi:hypothetical protein
MMPLAASLRAHDAHPCDAIRRFDAALETRIPPSTLRFRYRIEGDIGGLRLPPSGLARRCDGLWHHSCFEAFLRPDASESYLEFNFAPSGDWAAYRFGGRRSERTSPGLPAPAIRVMHFADHFELTADVDIAGLPELARAGTVHAGLAAVIENTEGARSYWALAHHGAKPDFHDPAAFLLSMALP